MQLINPPEASPVHKNHHLHPPTKTHTHLSLQEYVDRNLQGSNYNVGSEQHPIEILRFYGSPLKNSKCKSSTWFHKPENTHWVEMHQCFLVANISFTATTCKNMRHIIQSELSYNVILLTDLQLETTKFLRSSFKIRQMNSNKVWKCGSNKLQQHFVAFVDCVFFIITSMIVDSREHMAIGSEKTFDMLHRYRDRTRTTDIVTKWTLVEETCT